MQKMVIESFPKYKITNKGEVISYYFNKERLLKPWEDKKGYMYVSLVRYKKKIHKSIHRLVAEAYIPNPRNLPEINHKDGNIKNNNSINLEWCTRLENVIHAYDTGLMKNGRSKVRGVTWVEERKRWVVRFQVNGKRKFFGYFIDQFDAESKAEEILNEEEMIYATHF